MIVIQMSVRNRSRQWVTQERAYLIRLAEHQDGFSGLKLGSHPPSIQPRAPITSRTGRVELTEAANAIREKLVEHQISRPEKDWEARFILNYPSCLLFDYPFDL